MFPVFFSFVRFSLANGWHKTAFDGKMGVGQKANEVVVIRVRVVNRKITIIIAIIDILKLLEV